MAADFPLKVSLGVVDRLTAPMSRMQRRLRGMFAPVAALNARFRLLARTAGLPGVARGLGSVGRSLGGVGRELGAVVRKFGLVGAAAVGAAVAIVTSFAKAGDSIAKTADKIGIGTDALQEYRFAADRAGVPLAKLDKGLERFVRNVGEAAALGTGEGAEAFKALGLSMTDTEGRMRPAEELLLEVADRLSAIEDQSIRAALAAKLFGRDGVSLTNMLRGGSAGMREMAAEARRLGLVMGEDSARASERFVDAQTNLAAALTGVRNVIGGALLPHLHELVERFTAFTVRVRPQVEAFARDFMAKLPGRLEMLRAEVGKLVDRFRPLIDLAGRIVARFGVVRTVLGAVAVVIGAKLIVAVAALVGSLATLGKAVVVLAANLATVLVALTAKLVAFGVALLATPVGWILAGLAALAVAAVLIIRHWDGIKAFFVDAWRGVVAAFRFAFEWAKVNVPGFSAVVGVVTAAWEALPAFFSRMWEGIKETFRASIRWISDRVHDLAGFLPDWLREDLGLQAPAIKISTRGHSPFGPLLGLQAPKLPPSDAFDAFLGRRALQTKSLFPSAPPRAPAAEERVGPQPFNPEALIRVEFGNMPRGVRPRVEKARGVDLELSAGYSMVGG